MSPWPASMRSSAKRSRSATARGSCETLDIRG
jgi:hypothetical protein